MGTRHCILDTWLHYSDYKVLLCNHFLLNHAELKFHKVFLLFQQLKILPVRLLMAQKTLVNLALKMSI